jgi:hypothetical protein
MAMLVLGLCVATGGVAAQGMEVPVAGPQFQKRSIQVRGQATMWVEPDVAYLSLGVETQGDTAAKAQGQLGERASNVLGALSRAGIDRAKMKTSSYRVSPVYSTRQDKQNVIIGYKAETTIDVEVADLPSVAGLVDTAMSAGANAVRSISYDRKDMQALKTQLIQAACMDAKMKADAAATVFGARAGAPVSVDIQDSFSARETGNIMMMKAAAQDFLSPGELDISVSVSVEFELRIE